jgi:hypothetical protein
VSPEPPLVEPLLPDPLTFTRIGTTASVEQGPPGDPLRGIMTTVNCDDPLVLVLVGDEVGARGYPGPDRNTP